MQVLVTFRHIDATEPLRQYAEHKVARVYKLMRRPIEAHVVLSVTKRRHMAEITLSGEHMHVNAAEETGDLYSAIDLAMDKIERQIREDGLDVKKLVININGDDVQVLLDPPKDDNSNR